MTTANLDARRMRIRGIVRVAAEALPAFWPMRTFVHHNPLHGLEDLPFDQAVRQGERLFGGRGYLSGDQYRGYMRSGRIRPEQLDEALARVEADEEVWVGDRRVTQREALRATLTQGVGETARHRDPALVKAVADRLAGPQAADHEPLPGSAMTLAGWCDHVLGTHLVDTTNQELIKWCEAFLDEGHATWPMPGREQGLYLAWRALAAREWRPCGIKGSRKSIQALPDDPAGAILDSLAALGIPDEAQEGYLTLELAALPGWVGFIKWRSEHAHHPWQKAYPASLVKYLAIRLWYQRELVAAACKRHLGIEGNLAAISAYIQGPDHARRKPASRVASPAAEQLVDLATALELPPQALRDAAPETLATLHRWLDAFPEAERGAVWQRAFEAGYQQELLGKLTRPRGGASGPVVRPQSQSMYCMDVRTEPFRRHLEATGDHETFAFAGFFGAAIRFRPFGRYDFLDQVPAVQQARNEVREVPRSYHEHLVPKHRARSRAIATLRAILSDLKENVVTPYVMVESLGWFYGLPLVGKTLMPRLYHAVARWFGEGLLPPIPTTLTVDKLSPADVEAMVGSEQRDAIWKALRAEFGQLGFDHLFVEALRRHALGPDGAPAPMDQAMALGLEPRELEGFIQTLRQKVHVEARSASRRKERLTRLGLTLDEQVATVDMVLRTMGLVRNFARVVLVCGHGSSSENNPYEAALDCGACGGNAGSPNARAFAHMANNPKVRERLAKTGIEIPADTHFLGGQLDTTTDAVHIHDLEDVPPSHRKDVARLHEDLGHAGRQTSAERLKRLPDANEARLRPYTVAERAVDWSQVRPEWGLSGNAALIVGPRNISKGLDLGGRAFTYSYDHRQDPTGRLLEVILTGPQLVAQWICMEHYFSTTGPEVYGSGSKVYHNVAGHVGVMTGAWSDLRMGLARQTVMTGDRPYHEPLRLLTLVSATRARLESLIARHTLLQNYYHREWVHLVVWDPDDSQLYRYQPDGTWSQIALESQPSLGKEPIA